MQDDPDPTWAVFNGLNLKPITLEDQPLFRQALTRLAMPVSDYSFANTVTWNRSLRLGHQVAHNHLCVFANGTGDLSMLMPPLPLPGATDADLRAALEHAFNVMDTYNRDCALSRIEYVSDEMIERINAVTGGDLQLSAAPMGGDYVYPVPAMIDLPGKSLKSKRHARNHFIAHHPNHTTERMTQQHVATCIALLERWHTHGDAAHVGEITVDTATGTDTLRGREAIACRVALEHFDTLGLTGLCLFVDNQLIGFTLGEELTPGHASVLFEKTDPDYDGAAAFIYAEFCRQCWSHCAEVNAGDDWGIPSLRFTKSSYRPSRMLNKSILTRVARPPQWRPAEPRDLPAMLDLEQRCFALPDERFNRRQLGALLHNPRAISLVAESDGKVVGSAVGLTRQTCGRLYGLAVDPAMRGRGIGAQLADRMLDALAARGAQAIHLEVRKDNVPARTLYERLGFTAIEDLPDYYTTGVHAVRMRRSAQQSPCMAMHGLTDQSRP